MSPRKATANGKGVLKNYPDNFIYCRPGGILRHSWALAEDDPAIAYAYQDSSQLTRIPRVCERCETFVVVCIDNKGEIVTTGRRYPKGYRIPNDANGNRPFTGNDYRKEVVSRLT